MKKWLYLIFLLSSGFFFIKGEEKTPSSLYLTWMHDPTSTMTVQWHSGNEKCALFYRMEGEENWSEIKGFSHLVPQGTLFYGELFVHTVELTALLPDTTYAFHLANDKTIYKFRTMPREGERPVHFVIGGDVYQDDIFLLKKMNTQVAKMDPDFVVLGGDIAYTRGHNAPLKGRYFEMKRWQTFFKEWKRQMITSDGRLIPLLVALGNHDVSSSHIDPHKKPVLFYELFALPDPLLSYRALDFGNYLTLFFLDTGHSYPIAGKQTEWLEKALGEREEKMQKIPIYHVGAYPSLSRPTKKASRLVRANWSPLFERFGVKTAFEHHDHTYKRTFPIKEGKVDSEGVVYLGDGGWGSTARVPDLPTNRWYLEKSASANFVYLISIQEKTQVVQAIDNEGRIIDELVRHR